MPQLPAVALSAATGAITVEGVDMALSSGVRLDAVQSALANFYCRSVDHNNGYKWLSFGGLSFAGRPCSISACFKHERLTEVHWGVSASDAKEANWPSREDIEEEVTFVRSVLSKSLARSFSSGSESFSWGRVWSVFDPKGFIASTGVQYV
jgi:hypothetical protein